LVLDSSKREIQNMKIELSKKSDTKITESKRRISIWVFLLMAVLGISVWEIGIRPLVIPIINLIKTKK
jgi:hypothetical protein